VSQTATAGVTILSRDSLGAPDICALRKIESGRCYSNELERDFTEFDRSADGIHCPSQMVHPELVADYG
jgi:hypothetical protein